MFQTLKTPMTNSSSAVEVNKVYKTSDLSIFKTINGNRVPNLGHVKRLTDSIKVYGMKCNPILVNEYMQVIDGQHRLIAAKETKSFIYYIVINGYTLNEVHTLNLNQKNWTKKDFMEGYANMGVDSYIKLSKFIKKNEDFRFGVCVAMCSNRSRGININDVSKLKNRELSKQEVFEEGTWRGKNFEIAQEWANKIRMIKPYYIGYNRSAFVMTIIGLLKNKNFDFNEFMHKLRLQPSALVDCANTDQYKTLIEDIYNWRSRQKVNLRY
jgi:hypothetical protein